MLAQPPVLRAGTALYCRAFAATTIKCDLSRPHFPPTLSAPPINFSHAATASKILALQPFLQQQAHAAAPTLPVSFARSLPSMVKSIAAKCSLHGPAAVVELPCSSEITDAIADSPLKMLTLGAGPDWHVSAGSIAQAATSRTSLIVLQSVNAATGLARAPTFFSSLLSELDSLHPSRRMLLLVDHSHSALSDSWAGGAAISDTMASMADLGAAIGAPDRCCVIRGGGSALHAAIADHPLQPSSAAVLERLSSAPAAAGAPNVLQQNAAVFRAWMQRECSRLRWNDPGLTGRFAHCLVSIAPGLELDCRRFYSELERRGGTRVGRGSEWSVDDSNFRIVLGHVDNDTLKHGLQAISSALDVWASSSSNLGLSSIY